MKKEEVKMVRYTANDGMSLVYKMRHDGVEFESMSRHDIVLPEDDVLDIWEIPREEYDKKSVGMCYAACR